MTSRVLKGLISPLLKSPSKALPYLASLHSNVTNPFPSTVATLVLPARCFRCHPPWNSILIFQPSVMHIHSLTDTRLPKRRPSDKPRRKRASLKPPGPYAWVPYVPGEPIASNRPNEGSVKGRNQRKRMKQRQAFIVSEAKKRKAEMKEARRKRNIERIERKMAAVARDRAWAERLAELQKRESEMKEAAA
ncbi:uncharacterized protein LOC116262384 [Nymphaea colorata]|nr:uncharacterized protein LOC116262384 [Nymphaea colorata]XP_031497571.1 uncharacterized protein LOC116262384 [Nymphaea colorata]XP_031497572.1 uncharacterized protein LOC116262384 [Nymphaea colorata]